MGQSTFVAVGVLCDESLFGQLYIPNEIPSVYPDVLQPVRMWKVQNPTWENPQVVVGVGQICDHGIAFSSPENWSRDIPVVEKHLSSVIDAIKDHMEEDVKVRMMFGMGERILTNPCDPANKWPDCLFFKLSCPVGRPRNS